MARRVHDGGAALARPTRKDPAHGGVRKETGTVEEAKRAGAPS